MKDQPDTTLHSDNQPSGKTAGETTEPVLSDTVVISFETVEHAENRLRSLGLLEFEQVRSALENHISTYQQIENGQPAKVREFCIAVFTEATGYRVTAIAIVKRLIDERSGMMRFNDDGVFVSDIGDGVFGTVHEVFFFDQKKSLAVKISKARPVNKVLPDCAEHTTACDFAREVQVIGDETSSDVLPAFHQSGNYVGYGVNDDVGMPYYAMEFIRGHTLGDILKRVIETKKPISPQAAIDLLAAFVHAITKLDAIHRDIKPDNTIVTDARTIVLPDPGMAKNEHSASATQSTDMMKGTPLYSSPTQLRKPKYATKLDDLYAAAATVYHLVVGEPPVPDNVVIARAMSLEENYNITFPPTLEEEAPALVLALKAMLQHDRSQRMRFPKNGTLASEDITDGLAHWQDYLAEFTSTGDMDDGEVYRLCTDQPLPENISTPDQQIARHSRVTRDALHQLLSKNNNTSIGTLRSSLRRKVFSIPGLMGAVAASVIIIAGVMYWLREDGSIEPFSSGDTSGNVQPDTPPPDQIVLPNGDPVIAHSTVTPDIASSVSVVYDVEGGNAHDIKEITLMIDGKKVVIPGSELFRVFSRENDLRGFLFAVNGEQGSSLNVGHMNAEGKILIHTSQGDICYSPGQGVVWSSDAEDADPDYLGNFFKSQYATRGHALLRLSTALPENVAQHFTTEDNPRLAAAEQVRSVYRDYFSKIPK